MKFDIGGLISKLKPKKDDEFDPDDEFGIGDDIDDMEDTASKRGGAADGISVEETGEDNTDATPPESGGRGENSDEEYVGDEPPDDDFEFEDPFEEEEGKSPLDDKKKKLILFGGIGAAAVLVLSVGGWLIFSGDDEAAEEASQRVALALPKMGEQTAAEGVAPVQLGAGMGLSPKALTQPQKPGALMPQSAATPGSAPTPGAPQQQPGQPAQQPMSLNAAKDMRPAAIGSSGIVVPMSTPQSFSKITRAEPGEPLPSAPLPELIESTAAGPLPKIATDGRQPWNIYARPMAAAANQPRISIIVKGLGLSESATQAAIDFLPPEVTLAFDVYGKDLLNWVQKAREKGHEVLITLPMEPVDYPASDPGPDALMTTATPEANLLKLNRLLAKTAGYVGLITDMGSQFTASEHHLRPVLIALKNRGVMIIDSHTSPASRVATIAAEIDLPRAFVNLRLDETPSPALIDAQFQELVRAANKYAVAVGVAEPLPVSLDRIAAWVEVLERQKVTLAPVSSVANRQIAQ